MTFTIELTPDEKERLAFARELGFNPEHFFRAALAGFPVPRKSNGTGIAPNARTLLAMPEAERERILLAQVERARAEYKADLALPVEERELTAFTALDEEPLYEYGDIDKARMLSENLPCIAR